MADMMSSYKLFSSLSLHTIYTSKIIKLHVVTLPHLHSVYQLTSKESWRTDRQNVVTTKVKKKKKKKKKEG